MRVSHFGGYWGQGRGTGGIYGLFINDDNCGNYNCLFMTTVVSGGCGVGGRDPL